MADLSEGARHVRTTMLVFSFIPLLVSAAFADTIILEAEDYVASYNAGGDPIYVTYCSGASGYYAVDGFDTAGDFIELRVVLDMAAEYDDTLRSAGELFEFSQIRAKFRREGHATFAYSSYMTYGYGLG